MVFPFFAIAKFFHLNRTDFSYLFLNNPFCWAINRLRINKTIKEAWMKPLSSELSSITLCTDLSHKGYWWKESQIRIYWLGCWLTGEFWKYWWQILALTNGKNSNHLVEAVLMQPKVLFHWYGYSTGISRF